jgi:hypothetical protein
MPAELKSLAINEIDLCVAKYPTAPGIDVLIALRTTLHQSISNNVTKNINFIKWTDNLEKNQMKKEKLFSDLWDNIYIKIKQYI